MSWLNDHRPGYFGRSRDAKVAALNATLEKGVLDFRHGWSDSLTHMTMVQQWVKQLTSLSRRIREQIPKVQRAHGFDPDDDGRIDRKGP